MLLAFVGILGSQMVDSTRKKLILHFYAIGVSIMALVFSAMVLTVVFATRGALAGSRDIVEVLHFVGAEASFVARQFHIPAVRTLVLVQVHGDAVDADDAGWFCDVHAEPQYLFVDG